MIHSLKSDLRKKVRRDLAKLSHQQKKEKSRAITEHIRKTQFWHRSRAVFCFISMKDEVITDPIIEAALAEGKLVAVPHMHDHQMDFHLISSLEENWDFHPYGIREPRQDWTVIDPADYDEEEVLLVTPGLAFDRKGERLGRGKGFYDRFLGDYCGIVVPVAVCYHIQLVNEVPSAEHDCPVWMIITEQECIEIDRE